MYALGRTLQTVALVILPLSIMLQLEGSLTLWQSLTASTFGILLFATGYVLQGLRKQ